MSKVRATLAFIVAAVLILSSGIHTFVGWPSLHTSLLTAHVPADLMAGILAIWIFAGVIMFACGCIIAVTVAQARRSKPTSLLPARIIAIAYVAFGAWALAVNHFDPFFHLFLVPGLLLAAALPFRNHAAQ